MTTYRSVGAGVLAALLASSALTTAARSDDASFQVAALSPTLDRIVVVASKEDPWEVPGATTVLDADDLAKHEYGDILRILRLVPGVNLQEEDGFGLRPNIGLRGTSVERSSKITVMEDGVLIAPAPYAASSAYYFPRAARMSGVEVTKGPAAVKYGPYTTGGAINLTSTPIPEDEVGGFANLLVGEHGTTEAHAAVGGTYEGFSGVNVGMLLETLQEQSDGFKELDGGGDTGYDIEDYVGKIRLSTKDTAAVQQSLEFKVQYSEEISDETYLGLTDADFAATPYRRYAGSQEDVMTTDHKIFQLTHRAQFDSGLDLTTMAYRTEFRRDWFKINDVVDADFGKIGISTLLANPELYTDGMLTVTGAAGHVSQDDAIAVKHNNREYYATGIQSVLGYTFTTGDVDHDLEISIRYHEDEEDRHQFKEYFRMENGDMILTSVGAPGSDSNRVSSAEAWAFFIRDEITMGDFHIVPGLRYESIDFQRLDYGKADPDRLGTSLKVTENSVNAFIPSLAVSYDAGENTQVFAGIHKGFAPAGPGNTSDEETSWNFEAGVRYADGMTRIEAIGFYSDYQNLVGVCTASSGGDCTIGDQFDGGAAESWGLEVVAATDLATSIEAGDIALPVSLTYTFTNAEFSENFDSSFDQWGSVTAGDEIPYIPEHQLTLQAGMDWQKLSMNIAANYVSSVRVVAGSGPIPEAEKVDSHFVVDLSGSYQVTDGVALFAQVKNLFDETYSVARRPAGLRPGLPQTVQGGVKVSF